MTREEWKQKIDSEVKSKAAYIFMKGTPSFPMCGFSAHAVDALKSTGVEFGSQNVLEDADMFAALKEYSNWPTSPQIFVKGEFVGGCDIVLEMAESGELQKMIDG